MRLPSRSSLLLLLGLAALGCQPAGQLSQADLAALKTSGDDFTKAALAADWASIAAMYTDDAVLMPPNQPAVQSRQQIQAWFAAFPMKVTAFQAQQQQVEGEGNVAYIRGTYSMTLEPKAGGAGVQDHGKYLEVHRKQADGSWKVVDDIFNSDLPQAPPPEAKPAASAKKPAAPVTKRPARK